MDGVNAAEDWLDAWVGQVNSQATRSVELSRRVASLTGTAEGRDGAIRVRVGSAGQVEGLELDERVRELSGPRLAEEIMSVMRRAQARLSRRVADEVRVTVGEDTETGRAVLHSFEARFPAPSGEEDR
ncbi:YbaB/EbfC family nucleoid-associated protein [Paractinoplanes ferrugineus]|uniref:YbaB/EbfC family nucleoid-associated protein n=1 Tax=Paractinoplanes ferrugineus TaxID=113564 RepID=UPI001942D61F|nr:YbaB/EbfC family nucleoid-associated protein [Actinoplanes ferrugineus]